MCTRPYLLALIVTLCGSGCSHQAVLMETPAIARDGLIDPFEDVLPERQGSAVPVFVASTRTLSGDSDPATFYTNDRSREVRLGRATVDIGAGMTWPELVKASRAERRRKNPTIDVVAYEEYGALWSSVWPDTYRFDRDWDAPGVDRAPAERFVEDVEEILASSRRRQVLVYVHGFYTRFEGNLELTSEFWHYMARDGVVVSFDWPSKAKITTYQVDKANANFAIRQLREFLIFLAENTTAECINVIGHSAGCPVVVEALRQLSLMYYDLDDEEAQRRAKIGRVVMAAPDMDLDTALSAGVDGGGRVTQGWAVYASRKDRALGVSGSIFRDVRLGKSIGHLSDDERNAIIRNNTQWIDVTAAQRHESTFTGHSYYHQNPWVSSDIMLYLQLGVAAEERGLIRDYETGFLVFPDDYVEQLPAIYQHLEKTEISE